MPIKLYVGNLAFSAGEKDLQILFSSIGEVDQVKIVTDRQTGRSKGFGFVQMTKLEDAQEAIRSLNGKEFQGRPLRVDVAKDSR